MADSRSHTLNLPNGHTVTYTPYEEVGQDAYILEVRDGDGLVGRFCSCNGVSIPCPEGKSPSCDCTKNPPVLTCV
ncbi:MAG: hypothetical protein ACE5HQ_13525 [Gemmatimonadota bacterium]